MAEGFRRYWDAEAVEILIPVPLHLNRLRERGFNQSLLLVKELSRRTGISYQWQLLEKKKPTAPQVNLSGTERERGVRGAFSVRKIEAVEGRKILLVDDVYTTGATVNECARVLIAAGAERVDVFTLAHALKAF